MSGMPGGFVDGETYLETMVESLATLPAEMRRNLELMKDMDGSCSSLSEEIVRVQQEYLHRVEEKMGQLEVVEGTGVRVLRASRYGEANATTNDDDDDDDSELPVVIPTTEELLAYVHEPSTRSRIEALRADALQQAEEKIAIANQTYELVDNFCRKLDADLQEMERTLLPRSGTDLFGHPSAGGNGAVSVASSSATSGAASLAAAGGRGRGAPKKDDLAAVQEVPSSPDWILAKVISHDPSTGMFQLSDEDMESNKIFNLPESQVILLERMRNVRIGDVVFAVYPDTTSFYQGTIAQPPRKAAGGGMFVMVTFVDDEDATGKTLDKAVLLKHIMPPPY